MSRIIRVRKVRALQPFVVQIELTNGKRKTIDLEPFFRGPIFDLIRKDIQLFNKVSVDKQLGTLIWPNGADIDPDVLVGSQKPSWSEHKPKKKSQQSHQSHLVIKESKALYKVKKRKKLGMG